MEDERRAEKLRSASQQACPLTFYLSTTTLVSPSACRARLVWVHFGGSLQRRISPNPRTDRTADIGQKNVLHVDGTMFLALDTRRP